MKTLFSRIIDILEMNKKAIGIFDSGIGGLTVYRALKEKLPYEKIIYLGDTARVPYGTKSKDTIIKFSLQNAEFLFKKDVKIIVIACNTSSSYALKSLQNSYSIPIVGVIEPGSEAAVNCSNKKVGIIGTYATINSKSYEKAIKEKNKKLKIYSTPCPLFVPLVEEGWIEHEVTEMIAREYLNPLKSEGIDSLVLGCTHYPVLKNVIKRVMGNKVKIIDSASTVSEKVFDILTNLGWLNERNNNKEDEFYVTDSPDRFKKVGEFFLGKKINQVRKINI